MLILEVKRPELEFLRGKKIPFLSQSLCISYLHTAPNLSASREQSLNSLLEGHGSLQGTRVTTDEKEGGNTNTEVWDELSLCTDTADNQGGTGPEAWPVQCMVVGAWLCHAQSCCAPPPPRPCSTVC